MPFCSRCRRRISGGSCPCADSAESVAPPVPRRATDVTGRLAARRANRSVALVFTAVVAVVGFVVALAIPGKSGSGSSSSGYSAAGVNGVGSGSGGYQPTYQTYPDTPTTETSAAPAYSGDALDQLRQYANSDLPAVRATLEDHWVAQLSSKKVGLPADGIIYDAPAILQDHLGLRSRFTSVRLIRTADWSSFKYPDFWVTVHDEPFRTADEANAWCDRNDLPKDDCYAKRLRSTGGYEGNTKVR
ncbi:hypothetical protein [Amycolatopsis sp. CA-126428]|uniref:hypothetical protein n=1 Tax=Amycolatopsis sp. CA-126428 TaxID=2073158 RepID=UPI0011B0E399|nr:hypothetical protein [Amycolatopsis sp. CA-126428]